MPESTGTLLIIPELVGADPLLRLPPKQTNLFDRIICDPTAPDRPARERLCAEMLCAVLLNTTTLRDQLMTFFVSHVRIPLSSLEGLRWQFSTEQPIGSKRDDLRIEGWQQDGQRALLFTVEVKVGASIHQSSPLDPDSEENAPVETVSQLVNYDQWLGRQVAQHKAGVLLVLRTREYELPCGLKQRWTIISWTLLAQIVEDAIWAQKLSSEELLLARHLAGFIRLHLWKEAEVSDSLTFDDIALIRVFAKIGPACIDKVKSVVGEIRTVLDASDLGDRKSGIEDRTFGHKARAYAWKYLTDDEQVWLGAGLTQGWVSVWVESPPRYERKDALRGFLEGARDKLLMRNTGWYVNHEGMYWDAGIEIALEKLAGAENQQSLLMGFVNSAIEDLRSIGLFDELRRLSR